MDTVGTIDQVIKPNGHLVPYGVRIHFTRRADGSGLERVYSWLTVRYSLKSGKETEWAKLQKPGALKAERYMQAHVQVPRRMVYHVDDVSVAALVSAIQARELDIGHAPGGNRFLRCHRHWLVEDGADLRCYSSLDERHNVPRPSVDRLVSRYGKGGRDRYISAGHFFP